LEARRDVLASGARHQLFYGGARSAKTFLICYAIAARAQSAPGSRHVIARLHRVDVRQKVMLDTWPKMMRLAYPEVAYTMNRSDDYATLPGGSEVWFSGLDTAERVDKVLGGEYASIAINEASQVAFATVTTLRTRLAQAVRRKDGRMLPLRMYYDLNPVGTAHWTYKEFVQGIDPVTGRALDPALRRFIVMNPRDNWPSSTRCRPASVSGSCWANTSPRCPARSGRSTGSKPGGSTSRRRWRASWSRSTPPGPMASAATRKALW
jgi:PBSX family phage terminase large subunit